MKKICVLAITLALAGTARAQEDLDGAIRGLADKLSKEGLAGKLAEAAISEHGIQAIHEKIDFLLGARISRFERDAVGYLEEYLFSEDATGDLHLRPERKPEVDALVARLPLAPRAMSGFSRRADDIVHRLGSSEMDRRAKAAWSDPDFRTAFFHRHPAELRELDDAELLGAVGFRGLERGKEGKLRLAPPYGHELKSRMAAIFEQLDAVKKYEKSYLKLAAQVNEPAARTTLASDDASLFLIGRVLRQGAENAAVPAGSVADADEEKKTEAQITFVKDLGALLPEVTEGLRLAGELKAALGRMAAEIAGSGADERNVIEFLKNDRARILVAERILDLKEEQRRKSEEIMNSVLTDGFTAEGDRLSVKKGRYVDGDGRDSVDTLGNELNGIIEEFNGTTRQDFDRIAERCLEPGVIALLEDRQGTYLLQEFRDRVVDRLAYSIRNSGIDLFIRTYLTRKDDLYVVRPDRASRVEAILKRAADITAGK